jgi:hypothetical protein
MKKHRNKQKQQDDLESAKDFARRALAALSQKPVSETKVKAVAKKISKTMAKVADVLEH